MTFVTSYSREDRLWTVGYFDPDNHWHAMRDCGSEEEAYSFINFLNGGSGKPFGQGGEQRSSDSKRDTILVVNRVVNMLREAMTAPANWRATLESAIENLQEHGVDLLD